MRVAKRRVVKALNKFVRYAQEEQSINVALRRLVSDVVFFKQKTAYEIGTGDWSSDVCSSDLQSYPCYLLLAFKGF